MVAVAAPFGARPSKGLAARYQTTGNELFPIADGYATNIFYGDFVQRVANGTIEKVTGTTGVDILGVFIGCEYTEPNLNYRLRGQYYPANTVGEVGSVNQINAYVVTDPDVIFLMQANGPITLADVGQNAAIVQTAGVSQIGNSRNALDQTSLATTATLPLRIVDIDAGPQNAAGDAFTNVLVKINATHQYNDLTGV